MTIAFGSDFLAAAANRGQGCGCIPTRRQSRARCAPALGGGLFSRHPRSRAAVALRHVGFVGLHLDEFSCSENRCGEENGELSFLSHFDYVPTCFLKRASLQCAISEHQAPAWSCLAEPSLWADTKRERVSFCFRSLPCDGVSVLLGQRPLSKTLHTHRGWT